MLLGILSDTHGLLRPAVFDRFAGVDLIVHAGDVGDPAILEALGELAPVVAVRGNVDVESPLSELPATVETTLGSGHPLFVTHRREEVPSSAALPDGLVVFGHSHRPELEWHGGALWLNPGSCGRPRFSLPLTVARLRCEGRRRIPEILSVPI